MIYALLVLFTTATVFGISAQNKKTAASKWKYEVVQAPYGYNTGILQIEQQKDTLIVQLTEWLLPIIKL